MTPIRILALGAALLAAAGGVGGVLYATTGSAPFDTKVFPERLEVRLEVGQGAEIRTVELYPDRITAKHSIANHGDGSITNYWYRPDGTIEKAVTESKADEKGTRTMLRYAEVAADGRSYVLDIEYKPDGTKAKETRLAADGSMVRNYFHTNGNTRRAQTILREKQGWKLSQEDLFREDASLAESLRNLDNKAWERKFFSESGVLVGLKAMGAWESRYTEVAYFGDGKTKSREVVQNSSGTTLTTYRANGSREFERSWSGPVAGSSMRLMAYDDMDRQTYQQWWNYTGGEYKVWLVKIFREDKTLAKTLYLDNSKGESMEIVHTGDGEYGGNYMRRNFRQDGTLSWEEDVQNNKDVAKREFTVEQNIRMQNPAEWSAFHKVDAMPEQVIQYAPPQRGEQ